MRRSFFLNAPVLAPYGSHLHGPMRARTTRIPPPEPFDLWLTCRNAVAPFRDTAVVVGGTGFCSRASKHFSKIIHNGIGGEDGCAAAAAAAAADICIVQANHVPLRGPADLHAAFTTFAPLLRPNAGALCVTGAVLPGELVQSVSDELQQDWNDLVSWLEENSTMEELFSSSAHYFLSTDGAAQIREMAAASGKFSNTTLFRFDAEYELKDTEQQLSGLLRALPAYRRMCCDETVVDQQGRTVARRANVDVDPVEAFEELARLRKSNLQRLRVLHWMWVCDNRPRATTKDTVSLRLP